MSLSYNYPPQMAYPSAPPVYRGLPAPPRLHWGWVLALSVITLGFFGMIWLVVVAWWVKKASGNGKPFVWSLAYLLVIPFAFMVGLIGAVVATYSGGPGAVHQFTAVAAGLMRLSSIVLYIVTAFSIKGAMEAQPIDIPLSGPMTFFFAPFYFQYHLYDYSVEGRVAEQLSGFGEPSVAVAPVVADVPQIPPQV